MQILKKLSNLDAAVLLHEFFPNWFENPCEKISQKKLLAMYQSAYLDKDKPSIFNDVGFGLYSQSNEDGILLYLIGRLGVTNFTLLDIGSARPFGSNTTNLIVNFGWEALLIESNKWKCRLSQHFFKKHRYTRSYPPKILHKEVTVSNINEILRDNLCSLDLDLLSIDIDGLDYHVWKAINIVNPKIVVVEFNRVLGPDLCVAVKHADDFYQTKHDIHFHGASLSAYEKLGKSKGYDLIGFNQRGYNAFFVRSDLNQGRFAVANVNDCYENVLVRKAYSDQISAMDLDQLINLAWLEV